MEEHILTVGNKKVIIEKKGMVETLILLHADENSTHGILNACKEFDCTDFALSVISGNDWNKDFSPWKGEAVFQKGHAFLGGADVYIKELKENILPLILSELSLLQHRTVIASYSLAGLFSLYAAYTTDLFDGVISASGSHWFPGWMEYVRTHRLSQKTKTVYFSLGDKESKTKNQVLSKVEESTKSLCNFLAEQGIETILQMNQGGHFQENERRIAQGIKWSLHNMKS